MAMMTTEDALDTLSTECERLRAENGVLREQLATAHWEGLCGSEGVVAW